MSPISSIITTTAPPCLVSRPQLTSSKPPKLGSRLDGLLTAVRKHATLSHARVRNPAPVQCSVAEATEEWLVSSISNDAGSAAAGKQMQGSFLGRIWTTRDVITVGVILIPHLLSLLAPFYFTWGALWVTVGLYYVTGMLGLSLSYHRYLSHRSFKLPKWLEYTFAYFGLLAGQRDPIDWVSTHRYHHTHCDTDNDPHSPNHGFWFGHINWLFDYNLMLHKRGGPTNVGDLECQPFYRFLRRTWLIHTFGQGLLLYYFGGLPYLVWGQGVRLALGYHITFLLNSVCHSWGNQPWNTGDLSKNNWWVAALTFGDGWHNNHHAFQYSARHGLEWWQIDLTWYVICFLQAIGLATDVKLPSEGHKERLAFKPLPEEEAVVPYIRH